MTHNEFFNLDIKTLPTEVLKSIFHASRIELDKRRSAASISQREFSASVADSFKRMPHEKRVYSKYNLNYLEELMAQDWSPLFTGSSEAKFYVYAHFSPKTNKVVHECAGLSMSIPGVPFYIGKGCGQRAFDMNRNEGHGAKLRQFQKSGFAAKDMVCLISEGLTEPKALELESKLIYFFGTKFEMHRRGLLVNLDIPARPNLIK